MPITPVYTRSELPKDFVSGSPLKGAHAQTHLWGLKVNSLVCQ